MIPRTLSASSLQVAELCMVRWNAEYMNRAGRSGNVAADTGTAVHGALEEYVAAVFLRREHDGLDKVKRKELLITMYQMSYIQTFGTADFDTPHFTDGRDLCMKWFARTDLSDRTVLSLETKETFYVPFNHPEGVGHKCEHCTDLPAGQCQVPFNYVMDRLDQTGEDEYEVVDYKTIRVPIQPDDLETKIQARAYALACQIKFPQAKKIKVTFDLLRHEQVSFWFTKDDNIRFWRFLVAELQRIVDTPEADLRPTMNEECSWCTVKFTCPLMKSNISQGGIHALNTDEKAALLSHIKNQIKANNIMKEELEEELMKHASKIEELHWETDDGAFEVEIGTSRRRTFPADQAASIMGPELFAQMGSMTIGNLEKIIKDESLDPNMRNNLAALLYWSPGNLTVKVKEKKTVI